MNNYTPTTEEIEKHFSALTDSVTLINSLIEAADKSEENKNSVKRNYEHIEIMLAKDFIVSDTRDKSSFENAVTAGKEFIA
jgi:aspartate carbamoyltransferase catalytic subunit